MSRREWIGRIRVSLGILLTLAALLAALRIGYSAVMLWGEAIVAASRLPGVKVQASLDIDPGILILPSWFDILVNTTTAAQDADESGVFILANGVPEPTIETASLWLSAMRDVPGSGPLTLAVPQSARVDEIAEWVNASAEHLTLLVIRDVSRYTLVSGITWSPMAFVQRGGRVTAMLRGVPTDDLVRQTLSKSVLSHESIGVIVSPVVTSLSPRQFEQ